ncbi:ATP-binding protein [Aneurinibacillus sp. Ricciae_BoGa-3]|uniref:ATP-binding protein n=1 Tax=Aneurinibacillus sp. Ricciae_BoGa-3 TaxID=3022697 RepID=UPI002341D654|nr:ATP-binding protein [Aneurinibacillus sp. Ricciae_BoGa-3]WCK52562.1 ATP-binding protein [Aneurinibacillus sp. Ricciae_BoGa-3]
MIEDKREVIQLLTGVKSSKRNYYNELKKTVLSLQKKNMQIEIINQVVKSFNVDMCMDDMLKNVMNKLEKLFPFTRLSLSTFEKERLLVSNVHPQKLTAMPPGTVLDEQNSLYWKAIREEKAILHSIGTADKDRIYAEDTTLDKLGLSQVLLLPLFSKKRAVGILSLGGTTRINYETSDFVFLQQLADQLAVCIENSRLYNDVTKKLHIEAQLVQSAKLAAIGEMAAGVAHELNNPLTAVLGNTQLLLRESSPDSLQNKLLLDMVTCGKRCKNIIQNLLTFSRQNDYIFYECSLNQAVEQVLSLVGYQIERNNIHIHAEFYEGLPQVEGNLQQIEQIILNLLLNAKDAVEESAQDVKRITIRTGIKTTQPLEKFIFFCVDDNGCGIKEEEKGQIFNPFFTTKEARKGTGLGLSVSLGIAKAHGGTIEVESEAGLGSRFTLLLPVSTSSG